MSRRHGQGWIGRLPAGWLPEAPQLGSEAARIQTRQRTGTAKVIKMQLDRQLTECFLAAGLGKAETGQGRGARGAGNKAHRKPAVARGPRAVKNANLAAAQDICHYCGMGQRR